MDRKRTILEGTAYIVPTYPDRQIAADVETLRDVGLSIDEFVPSGGHDFMWRKGNEAIRLKAPPNDGIRFFRGIFWAIVISSLFWIPMLVEIFWGMR